MRASRGGLLLVLAGVALSAPAAAQGGDAAARFFLDNCASCHTVGRGDLDGPDLAPATRWQPEVLHEAIERMEENVGELDDATVESLVELLRDPALQRRLEGSAEMANAERAAGLQPADAALGRELFFGDAAFAAGGVGCFACHAAAGRGGNLASDLTVAWTRLGATSVLAAIGKPAFPLMKSAYGAHAVSAQETLHLAAFLEQAGQSAPSAAAGAGQGERVWPLLLVAAALAAAVILLVSAASRPRSARSRLVAASSRR